MGKISKWIFASVMALIERAILKGFYGLFMSIGILSGGLYMEINKSIYLLVSISFFCAAFLIDSDEIKNGVNNYLDKGNE